MNSTKKIFTLIIVILWTSLAYSQTEDWEKYSEIIKNSIYKDYKGMYREAGGFLKFPFLTPGSSQYADVLWDWDS